jgi:DNA polymerase-3 subunit epsilon
VLFSSPAWDAVDYLALDLETGGLDVASDPIVAVGAVPVRAAHVRLGEAYRTLVQPEDGRLVDPASVRAHQLVWGELREAPPLPQVLQEVAARAQGSVLVVHQRSVDLDFLRRAFDRHRLGWLRPRVVDTVDLLLAAARRDRFKNPELPADRPVLSLARARQKYGLPEYQAHDALTDAVAIAELFLVLRKVLGARTLRDLQPVRG